MSKRNYNNTSVYKLTSTPEISSISITKCNTINAPKYKEEDKSSVKPGLQYMSPKYIGVKTFILNSNAIEITSVLKQPSRILLI